jgi:hypothetical protein
MPSQALPAALPEPDYDRLVETYKSVKPFPHRQVLLILIHILDETLRP